MPPLPTDFIFPEACKPICEKLLTLPQVAPQVRALINSVAACPAKLNVGSLGGTAEGGHQQLPVRLIGIADIVNGRFQR